MKRLTRSNFSKDVRNIPYGVREFAMAAITNGIAASGLFTPYCATFFTFSDYMRNAIRLAALSHYPSIFIFTHDSVFVGEDGPTHQPIEHLASLRAIPNLTVFRPTDSYELGAIWTWILKHQKGPVVLVLTRQKVEVSTHDMTAKASYNETVGKGAYIIRTFSPEKIIDENEVRLFASGSEVPLAVDVAKELTLKKGCKSTVVSVVSFELFDELTSKEQNNILGKEKGIKRVSIEAGATFGWGRFVGTGLAIGIDQFGYSAKASDIQERLGFTVEGIIERINQKSW